MANVNEYHNIGSGRVYTHRPGTYHYRGEWLALIQDMSAKLATLPACCAHHREEQGRSLKYYIRRLQNGGKENWAKIIRDLADPWEMCREEPEAEPSPTLCECGERATVIALGRGVFCDAHAPTEGMVMEIGGAI